MLLATSYECYEAADPIDWLVELRGAKRGGAGLSRPPVLQVRALSFNPIITSECGWQFAWVEGHQSERPVTPPGQQAFSNLLLGMLHSDIGSSRGSAGRE